MSPVNELEPQKLYHITTVGDFLRIDPERIKRAYLRSDKRPQGLRFKKIGREYYFHGQSLIDDLLAFQP